MLECSPDHEAEVWAATRVGLGALGLISTVTLQTVPTFNLHPVEEPLAIDEVVATADELVDANEHLGMFWFPGSPTALVKRSNRTDRPPARAHAVRPGPPTCSPTTCSSGRPAR